MPHAARDDFTQQRVQTPVIDQHASWIAVNPVQGCPKACEYCFLNERGQTRVRPEEVATPAEAVVLLLESEFYAQDRTIALYTWTDVMALPTTRNHLRKLLVLLSEQQVRNPIVLITKCRIPPETLADIAAARQAGLQVIVYLSYSGLDREVERGIRHEHIIANFPALADADIPIVHYWRPALPESAVPETMRRVLGLAARYARCTVAAGLKVEAQAIPRLSRIWPELASTPGVEAAEGVYPRTFWDFIHSTAAEYPDHPVFHTNACALAYVFGRPDGFGIFGSHACRARNRCPDRQRRRCAAASAQPPTSAEIRDTLDRRGLKGIGFTFDADAREIAIDAAVPNRIVSALTQDLEIRIRAAGQGRDSYWSSGTSGARPLVLGGESAC